MGVGELRAELGIAAPANAGANPNPDFFRGRFQGGAGPHFLHSLQLRRSSVQEWAWDALRAFLGALGNELVPQCPQVQSSNFLIVTGWRLPSVSRGFLGPVGGLPVPLDLIFGLSL